MTQDNPAKLSFSIEESIWLNKGQEVNEIVSMSLEPQISIEEKGDHVSIRGGLHLIGEYRPVSEEEESANDLQSLQEQVSFRPIDEVSSDEYGVSEIKHHFPIDVTIPLNRIQNLDDIYVEVESFDYDLPERSCIQLTADITISGMNTENAIPVTDEERVTGEDVEQLSWEMPDQQSDETKIEKEKSLHSFQFESKREPTHEEEVVSEIGPKNDFGAETGLTDQVQAAKEPIKEEELVNHAAINTRTERKASESEEENDRNEPVADENDTEQESEASEGEYDEKEGDRQPTKINVTAKEQGHLELVDDEEGSVKQEGPKVQLAALASNTTTKKDDEDLQTKETERDEEEMEESSEEATYTSHKEENALYLTKMLTKGEEDFSKWRMCIVQENESLSTIADRYDISTSHLTRFNRLEDENVEEGQILYIPRSAKS